MPERQSVMLAVSSDSRSRIRLDAEYFRKRAGQCLRLAEEATDDDGAMVLRRLASAFKEKARSLDDTVPRRDDLQQLGQHDGAPREAGRSPATDHEGG